MLSQTTDVLKKLKKHQEARSRAIQSEAYRACQWRGQQDIRQMLLNMPKMKANAQATEDRKGHGRVLLETAKLARSMRVRVYRHSPSVFRYAVRFAGRYGKKTSSSSSRSGRYGSKSTSARGVRFRKRKKGGFTRSVPVEHVAYVNIHGESTGIGLKSKQRLPARPFDVHKGNWHRRTSELAINRFVRRTQRHYDQYHADLVVRALFRAGLDTLQIFGIGI